jgi:hypothetical protein
MAPRRPMLYMEQWPLALTTAVVLVACVGVVVWVMIRA